MNCEKDLNCCIDNNQCMENLGYECINRSCTCNFGSTAALISLDSVNPNANLIICGI